MGISRTSATRLSVRTDTPLSPRSMVARKDAEMPMRLAASAMLSWRFWRAALIRIPKDRWVQRLDVTKSADDLIAAGF